jgi:hypothetical protein
VLVFIVGLDVIVDSLGSAGARIHLEEPGSSSTRMLAPTLKVSARSRES